MSTNLESDRIVFGKWVVFPTSWGICRTLSSEHRQLTGNWSLDERVTLVDFDTRTRDAARWKQLRQFLNWLDPGPGRWARACYKAMRRYHDESKERTWEQALPRQIVEWANGQISAKCRGLSCVANWRVARVGSTAQNRRYRRQVSRGCCGFSDWEALGPDGKRYRLGFNWGH